jgi:diaminopimelate decarboxylase
MRPFPYHSGKLHCEGVSIASVAQRFGTPAYIYSQTAIIENYRQIQDVTRRVPGLICYSVKANSHLRILRLLRAEGAGFDVVSGGELARALRAGADPQRIVFSGVGKTVEEIDAGLLAGILMFNVESAGELEVIIQRAQSLRKTGNVSIRVNPDVEAETHPYISTGQAFHKFGVPKEQAWELYQRAASSGPLRARGIACHIGSQILDFEPFLRALEEIRDVALRLQQTGIHLEYLDIGGGFGIRYTQEKPLEMPRLVREVAARLKGSPYKIVLEPGRSIVGDAGILVTRVLYVKRNSEKSFVVVDAGMSDLIRPTLYGSHHQIVPVMKRARAKTLYADVVGPICETGDFLAQDRDLPEVEPGDLLAVLTAGAYGYVLASNYNSRPRPAEVMVHGRRAELIRPREKVQDLMAVEKV